MEEKNELLAGLHNLMPLIALASGWAVTWASLNATISVLETRMQYQAEQLQELRSELRQISQALAGYRKENQEHGNN
jgi:hypothetical protein